MSETVDTRVVEARFDSKQFEQGVDKTVKKLDELKKSLNLESTGKSVAEIGNKVEEATNKASNSLEKLQDRFTSFTGMLKQKLLSGIADEIVGVFFKIKSSFESLVTSMSTAQIGVGMQRYTDILTSVRTLVSAGVNQDKAYTAIERLGQYADQTSYSLDSMVATMSKFKTAGADIDTAARMIEGLSNAAASMGVNAQQAERAYLNLQQAYSKKVMLQNDWISFESIPMVGEKFNQAIIDAAVKVGTLKESKGKAKIDPKVQAELEKKLKDQIISQDEYNTELEKLRNAKTYETVKKSGAKIRSAKGITASNMSANLASRWFTDEVMEEVFGNTYFFGEVGIRELNAIKQTEKRLKEQFGTDEEGFNEAFQKELDKTAQKRRIDKIKELDDALAEGTITSREYHEQLETFDKSNVLTVFGYNCLRAGQEARSFTDVLNTLKDAISRGWATSFELIFGRLDEAADFFTKLTESNFANAIYAIGEFRNAVLESWSGSGGRENMLGVLEYMDEIAGNIFEKLGLIRDSERYFNEHFDEQYYNGLLNAHEYEDAEAYRESIQDEADASPFERVADELGQRLAILGRDIRDFFEKVHNWFTEADSTGVSRLQRISNVLSAFGAVANGAFTAAGMGLEFIGKIYNSFKASFDKLWEVMDKLANKFSSYFDPNKAKEGIDIFQILSDTFENVLNVVSKLNGPLTTLIGVLGDVAGFFLDIGVGTFLTNIQFFTDVFAALLELIGLGSAQQERGAGVIEGIGKEIENLGTACKDAFQAVSDFFTGLFDDLRNLLGIGNQVDGEEGGFFKNIENWFNTNKFIQNVKGWIDQAIKDIKAWFADLPNKISGIGISIGDFFKSIFYYKTSVANTGTVWVKKDFARQIEKTFKDMLEAVKKWFKELPSKAKSLGITIGDFFKSIFYYKTSVANTGTVWVKKDFTRQIENVFNDIKNWLVKDFPMFLHSIFAGVGDFVTMVWNALIGNNQTAEADNAAKNAADQTQAAIDNSFANVTADGILGKLQTVASDIWNGILTIFTGNSDKSFNDTWLAGIVSSAIENIGSFAQTAWDKTKNFIVELPDTIKGLFDENNEKTKEKGTVWSAISGFANRVATWISEIPGAALDLWKNIEKQTGTLWDTIIGWITGEKSDNGRLTKAQQETIRDIEKNGGFDTAKIMESYFKQQNWREDNPIFANLEDFFNNLKDYFINKITHLPENIANGLANGAKVFESLIETATGWINEDIGKENLVEVDLNTSDENGKNSSFLESLETFGKTIWSLITETIPKFIGAGFEWIKVHAESWAEAIKGLFSGGEKTAEEEANSFGDKIKNVLQKAFKQHTFSQDIYNQIYSAHGLSAAESYREQTSNPIVVFFKNIVTTIGNIFKDIGPAILNGINTALNWIGGKLGDATEFIKGLVAENKPIDEVLAEKMEDKDNPGKENPLWEAVKSIGQTIWTMLTETIPAFISSAATYIAQQVPKLFAPIFGNNTEKEIKKITQEELFAAAEAVNKYSSSDMSEAAKKAREQYDSLLKEYNKQQSSSSTNSPGLLDMFGSMLGINSANAEGSEAEAEKKGNVITNVIDIISGVFKSISEDNVLKVVGIAFAIGYLLNSLRVIVDNIQFIDDIGWTAKWVGISTLMVGLTAFLGYLAVLAAQGEELTDEEKAAGKKTKFERVKEVLTDFINDIKSILTLVSVIMGLLAAKEFFAWRKEASTTSKEMKKAGKDTTSIINDMTSGATDMENGIMQLASKDGPLGFLFGENGFLSGALNAFGTGLTGTVGKVGGAWLTGGLIGDLVEQLAGNANDALGQLGSGIESLSSHLDETVKNLVGIKSDILDAIEVIPQVRDLISGLVNVLNIETITPANEHDTGAVWSEDAKVWVKKTKESVVPNLGEITKSFNDISGSLSLFKNSVTGYGDDATKVTDALKTIATLTCDMDTFAEFTKGDNYQIFKEALAGLGAILKLYSSSINEDFNTTPKKINISGVVEMLQQLFGDEQFNSLIAKFAEENKELDNIGDGTFKNSEKIIVFASALVSLAEACSQIKGGEGDAISKLIEEINKIKFTNDQGNIDDTVQNFGTLGNALGSFAANTANLSEDNIKNADYALTMLARIAVGLGAIPNTSGLFAFVSGDSGKDLGTFGQNIKELGQNLGHFMESVDSLSENGVSRTHNIDNLHMMLTALDEITRVAIQFTYLGSERGSLGNFKEFSADTMKPYFTGLAENLGAFISGTLTIGKVIDKETNEIGRFDDADFEYISGMIKYMNDLANILTKVTVLDFSNLPDDGSNYNENPLTHYLERLLGALHIFSADITKYDSTLKNLNKYKDDIQAYLDIVNDMYRMVRHTTAVGGNWDIQTNFDRISSVAEALFGWTSHAVYAESEEDIIHSGLFGNFLTYFDTLTTIEDKLNGSTNAVNVFNGICDVVSSFMRAIAQMAEAEAISLATTHGFTSDYSTYIERLLSVITTILNSRDQFEEFFDWGKNFSTESVSNVALMMTALNQIVQFVSTMRDTQSFTDTTLTNLDTAPWRRLFDIIQTTIIDGNKEFFEPKITPVLEITEDFKAKADELKETLGFMRDENGEWQSPNVNINITGIEIPQLTDINGKLVDIETAIGKLENTADKFNDSLSQVSFRIDINGRTLVEAIGPEMDNFLGQEGVVYLRGLFGSGTVS